MPRPGPDRSLSPAPAIPADRALELSSQVEGAAGVVGGLGAGLGIRGQSLEQRLGFAEPAGGDQRLGPHPRDPFGQPGIGGALRRPGRGLTLRKSLGRASRPQQPRGFPQVAVGLGPPRLPLANRHGRPLQEAVESDLEPRQALVVEGEGAALAMDVHPGREVRQPARPQDVPEQVAAVRGVGLVRRAGEIQGVLARRGLPYPWAHLDRRRGRVPAHAVGGAQEDHLGAAVAVDVRDPGDVVVTGAYEDHPRHLAVRLVEHGVARPPGTVDVGHEDLVGAVAVEVESPHHGAVLVGEAGEGLPGAGQADLLDPAARLGVEDGEDSRPARVVDAVGLQHAGEVAAAVAPQTQVREVEG